MTQITFVLPDGSRKEVQATDGHSVMETALANGIDDIRGECGGALACATCHVYVEEAPEGVIGAAGEDETDMLEFAETEVRPESRLCCQIKVAQELGGLVVRLPGEG